jgi:hypothetical protein
METEDRDGQKKTLEDKIDGLGKWMIGFTTPVAVGLLMETYAIFEPQVTASANTLIDRIGLMLVAAGVVGELLVEVMMHRMEHKLRTVNANIERQANETIAGLNSETEVLRKQNLEMASFLADRRVKNVFEFQDAMYRFRGTRFVVQVGATREARELALSLKHCLADAEWLPNEPTQSTNMLGEGVWVIEQGIGGLEGQLPCSDASETLADWLNENGLAAMAYLRDDVEAGVVVVAVGPKPSTPDRHRLVQAEREKQKNRRLKQPKPGGPLPPRP